jgi:hypothetical protein
MTQKFKSIILPFTLDLFSCHRSIIFFGWTTVNVFASVPKYSSAKLMWYLPRFGAEVSMPSYWAHCSHKLKMICEISGLMVAGVKMTSFWVIAPCRKALETARHL